MLSNRGEPNPIYKRLTQHAKPPTVAQAVVLTLILFAASIVLVISRLSAPLTIIEQIAIMLCPPVAAGAAAWITAQDMQTETFALQKITPLSHGTVVWGYANVALFPIRLLIALVVGLLPLLFTPVEAALSASNGGLSPGINTLLREALSYPALMIIPMLAVPACALFGVVQVLEAKRPGPATVKSIVISAIASVGYNAMLVLFAPAIWPLERCQACEIRDHWPLPLWIEGGSLVVISLWTFVWAWRTWDPE